MKHLLALLIGMLFLALFGAITRIMAYKPEWINLAIGLFLVLSIAYMIGIKVIEELKR